MQTIIVKGDLKRLRKKAKLTFRQLAKISGVHYAHLCHIERGLPTTEATWSKIKKALDTFGAADYGDILSPESQKIVNKALKQ